ncbi:hypothetical protein COCON_G00205700 [Conger conger]|uniref:Rho GDP dissociation inhibitor n=1 Tax=Conger conger TaxID=82655 RepID=A0A9Q1HPW7_CONCO|nr:hypothetical protein COCON_G00205700 [Conger conger]
MVALSELGDIMADKETEPAVPAEDDETDLNYQPPAQKSLQEIQELDKEDESLNKYKQALLGAGPVVADPTIPNVQVTRLTLICDAAPDQSPWTSQAITSGSSDAVEISGFVHRLSGIDHRGGKTKQERPNPKRAQERSGSDELIFIRIRMGREPDTEPCSGNDRNPFRISRETGPCAYTAGGQYGCSSVTAAGRPEQDCVHPGDLEALKKQNFTLKEGVDYRVKIHFKVNRDIVSGLKYVHLTYRKNLRVDKAMYMVGSYGPKLEEHEFMTPVEEAPKGLLVRGGYHIKSQFTDDDKTDHLSWEWNLQIKKEWDA